MKIALIANPCSGGGKAKKNIPEVVAALEESHIAPDLFLTRYHAHAVQIAANLDLKSYKGVVSLGGDGTNFHVLNGLMKHNPPEAVPPLGIIPVGSGNSFARDIGVQTIKDSISAITRGRTKAVDVLSFTQEDEIYYFVNLMGFGFVTDVAKTAVKFKRFGDLSYMIGVLLKTAGLRFHEMKLEIDNEVIQTENCFVEFCNSRYTGGNMLMAPDAEIDDGFFDIIITAPLTRINLLSAIPKIFKGLHGKLPFVRSLRAKKATVTTRPSKTLLPDGEIFGKTPTTITLHPKRARYFY